MSRSTMKRAGMGLLSAALMAVSGTALADWDLNLPKGVTPISHEVYDLHMMVIWICVVIGIVVFGAIFWSIIYHRKSKGAVAAQFHESTVIEIIWTIIPFVILVGMAVPASKTLIAEADTRNPDVTIKVTGYQWKWKYDYVNDGVSFYSTLSTPTDEIYNDAPKDKHYLREVDHPLVVPVHKKIRFLITSGDVIHSWWVPDFGWKADGIPGYIHSMWAEVDKPGVYRGQCAELCGRGHAFMPIVVVAKSDADFQKWLAAQQKKTTNGQGGSGGTSAAASASGSNGGGNGQASASNGSANGGGEKVAAAGGGNSGGGAGKAMSKADLMSKGKTVFDSNCATCHQASGEGVANTFPPLRVGKNFSASSTMMKDLKERGFLTADNKIQMGPVKHHIEIVLKGIPGTAMPPWGPQLSDADIASVITYERNAWGNNTGDVIQPSEVKAAR